jgi:hypothetical protein
MAQQDLYADLFKEATEDWTIQERDALAKRLKKKVKDDPGIWFDPGAASLRRERMIDWLNEEAARFMEAAAKLHGVGNRYPFT